MPGLDSLTLRDPNGKEFESTLPRVLLTGTGLTPKPRLRVDLAQTSFFEGREFRSYYDFSIAAGATQVFKFTSIRDFVLFLQKTVAISGNIRASAHVGGTEGGTFSIACPIIGKNRMSNVPVYASGVSISTGGTHTGGTETDLLYISAVQNGQGAIAVGGTTDDARGLPAGTYYLKFLNTSNETSVGVTSLGWEEREPESTVIN